MVTSAKKPQFMEILFIIVFYFCHLHLGITLLVCFGCPRNVSFFGALFFLCCFNGSFAPAMNQCTELDELEAVLATQELLAFESVEISEYLGDEFDKSACFQKPTTVNEIEQKERERIPTRQSTVWSINVYRV